MNDHAFGVAMMMFRHNRLTAENLTGAKSSISLANSRISARTSVGTVRIGAIQDLRPSKSVVISAMRSFVLSMSSKASLIATSRVAITLAVCVFSSGEGNAFLSGGDHMKGGVNFAFTPWTVPPPPNQLHLIMRYDYVLIISSTSINTDKKVCKAGNRLGQNFTFTSTHAVY
jgi:hypothetical protein